MTTVRDRAALGSARPSGTATAMPIGSARRPRPVIWLAAAGVLLIAFEVFVMVRWITGPHFTATPTGPDRISDAKRTFLIALEVLVSLLIVPCAWFWVIRPWRRAGR